jgi:hypothetical protein
MDESERIQRLKEHRCYEDSDDRNLNKEDEELAERIFLLLNHPKIDKYCMVDAYYYDFSVIPHKIQEELQLWRDAYLIFGISNEGEIISRWVDRWDLDSDDPIVDGKVIKSDIEKQNSYKMTPEIMQSYNAKLLSTPEPEFIKSLWSDQ